MAPVLEAGVFRESCLVLRVLLNIARGQRSFFRAAMQHDLGVGASLALFSNQGRDPAAGACGANRRTIVDVR